MFAGLAASVVVIWSTTGPAHAVPLAVADVGCSAHVIFAPLFDVQVDRRFPVESTTAASCSASVAGRFVSSAAEAVFERTAAQREHVSASLEGDAPLGFLSGGAVSLLNFFTAVALSKAPPRDVDAIPLKVTVSLTTIASWTELEPAGIGGVEAFATFRVFQGGELVDVIEEFARDGKGSFHDDDDLIIDEPRSVLFNPRGGAMLTVLGADCVTRQQSITANAAIRCSASADPDFEFDQAAFDAMSAAQGLPSFPLADFFRFEFSPNLGLSEPPPPGPPGPIETGAPPSVLLVLAGLGAICRRWRRRQPK